MDRPPLPPAPSFAADPLTSHVWDVTRMKQFVSFGNLTYGSNNRPTDVDALFEYKNKLFIIYEVKYGDAELQRGQFLSLTRLCDALQLAKPTLLIIARHNTPVDQIVDLAYCGVRKFRWEGLWYPTPKGMFLSVRGLTDKFIQYVEGMCDFPVTKQ